MKDIIEVIRYDCPYCKTTYDKKEEAISCAKSHCIDFKVIEGTGYHPHEKIPDYVIIECGNEIRHKYRKILY